MTDEWRQRLLAIVSDDPRNTKFVFYVYKSPMRERLVSWCVLRGMIGKRLGDTLEHRYGGHAMTMIDDILKGF